jgi:hypothetical protein
MYSVALKLSKYTKNSPKIKSHISPQMMKNRAKCTVFCYIGGILGV